MKWRLVGPGCKPMAFAAPMMTDEEGNQLEEPKKPQMLFQMQLSQAVPAPVHFAARSGVDSVTGTCYNRPVTSLRRNEL